LGPPSREIDWNEMAKTFDRWLPFIQPVADRLISLADISQGQEVLDVASGTGEPSLTISRRFGNQISLTGVDGAEAMVTVSNEKVQREGLQGVTFQQMKAERLTFPSDRFDRVISRFGVMLFDDPEAGLKEMRRVLKQGGKMAIGVWGEFHKVTSLYLIWEPLMKRLPEDERLPMPKMADLGPPGKLEALLLKSGFSRHEISPLPLIYQFEDFESYWKINTESGVLKESLNRLSSVEQDQLKKEVMKKINPYQKGGRITLQNDVLVALAIK
jgi:ubiquinone/menaquinone biosynthesis C-methylase UbiE